MHRLEERPGALLERGRLLLGLRVQSRRALEPLGRLGGQLLEPRERLFGRCRTPHPFAQLGDLLLHRPDHFLHAVGLDEGVLNGLLLAFDRFGLERDALGEGVERDQALIGVLPQRLELRERPKLLLRLPDRGHRGGRVFARRPRGFADPGPLFRQSAGHPAKLLELVVERAGALHRLLELGLRRAQLASQILERRVLIFESAKTRMRLPRLNRELVDRLPMLPRLAIESGRFPETLLRLPGRFLEILDLPANLLELPGAAVERREALADLFEFRRRAGHRLREVLERPGDGRQAGASLPQR